MITADQLPPRLAEGDPRGPLTFARPLPEPWQSREDSTPAHDFERAHAVGRRFTRPATATEIELLAALGVRDSRGEPPAPGLMTRIQVLGGIRMRTWPTLTPPAPAEDTTTITETEAPR